MDIRTLSPTTSVAPQILPSEVAELAARGFRTIVNNRPDGESPDQPSNLEIEAAARECGIACYFLPVISGHITVEAVDAFRSLLTKAEAPIPAFCRSGTRCTVLWGLAESQSTAADSIIQAARDAGYDLEGWRVHFDRTFTQRKD